MKRIFLLLLVLPLFIVAQTNKKVTPKSKTKVAIKPTVANDGFTITGQMKGFADGTTVALLNGQTGVAEVETVINKEKFILKGKVISPEFKILLFNKQPPYTNLFLDNSNITIAGNKATPDQLLVTGSPAHFDFLAGFTGGLSLPFQRRLLNCGQIRTATA